MMAAASVTWEERWREASLKMTTSGLQIQLSDPSYTGSSYTSRHITYAVTTLDHGWIVRRRYSEFVWLRATLATRFTGLFLPALPAKGGGDILKSTSGDLSRSAFVTCRQQLLRYFLEDLARIPFLLSDPSLLAFLSIQDPKEFAAAQTKTSQIHAASDSNEGIVQWRAALSSFILPLTWDRTVVDFQRQLDAMEANLKALHKAVQSHVEALAGTALSNAKFLECYDELAKQEAVFGDSTKAEHTNKDAARAMALAAASMQALSAEQRCSLTAPESSERILATGIKFLLGNISAFRDHLKILDELTKMELTETKILNAYLDDERNGKKVKKRGSFMTGMSSKQQSSEEIIEEQKKTLEDKSAQKNFFISAISFSEVDRFNADRTRFWSQIVAFHSSAERALAKERESLWAECLRTTGLPAQSALQQAMTISPLLTSLIPEQRFGPSVETTNPMGGGPPVDGGITNNKVEDEDFLDGAV